MLEAPLPGRKAVVSEATAEVEGAAFMELMQFNAQQAAGG